MQTFVPPPPEVREESQEPDAKEEDGEGAMEATITKLVEEADANSPAPEPRPSFWDLFRKK